MVIFQAIATELCSLLTVWSVYESDWSDYEMAINWFHIMRLSFISKHILVDSELQSRYKLKANVQNHLFLLTIA